MKEKDIKQVPNLTNTKDVPENKKTNSILTLLFLILSTFTILILVCCFAAAIINKDLANTFIIVMLGSLIYTLWVFIQNEKNLTKIINKSIKMHAQNNIIQKTNDKDFVLVIVDFLVIISSMLLIVAFMFIAVSTLIKGNVLSAAIFVLLIIFTAMLLYFWILIQRNNRISINIKQPKLKNIYKKSGVHLKFNNRRIKKKLKTGVKKSASKLTGNKKRKKSTEKETFN